MLAIFYASGNYLGIGVDKQQGSGPSPRNSENIPSLAGYAVGEAMVKEEL